MKEILIDNLKRVVRGDLKTVYSRLRWFVRFRRSRRLAQAIVESSGSAIQGGPFAGMSYLQWAVGSELCPKLVGSYECELNPALTRVFERGYDTVVNIGCGEGYYAVGLALRLPGARVYAFDTDPAARESCELLARSNGVSGRVTVGGECTPSRLRELLAGQSFVICDCEGCELHLLRPELVPELARADILVELHDFIDPSISGTITSRFALTHEITTIKSAARDPSHYPVLRRFRASDRRFALDEDRPAGMEWAFMERRADGARSRE